jgi:hypothetical protein
VNSSDKLVGLRVQITIKEDGTPNPPRLPPGTIVRKMTGTDNEEYYVVHLDSTVRSVRAKTGEEWNLSEIALLPHFAGVSLQRLISSSDSGFDFVHVRLINPIESLRASDYRLDLSKAVYFSLGRVKRV